MVEGVPVYRIVKKAAKSKNMASILAAIKKVWSQEPVIFVSIVFGVSSKKKFFITIKFYAFFKFVYLSKILPEVRYLPLFTLIYPLFHAH